jgi:hypothetical protein
VRGGIAICVPLINWQANMVNTLRWETLCSQWFALPKWLRNNDPHRPRTIVKPYRICKFYKIAKLCRLRRGTWVGRGSVCRCILAHELPRLQNSLPNVPSLYVNRVAGSSADPGPPGTIRGLFSDQQKIEQLVNCISHPAVAARLCPARFARRIQCDLVSRMIELTLDHWACT